MGEKKTEPTAIGLDIGTSRIVAAFQKDEQYDFKSELNSFVTLPASKMTEGVLRKEKVPHAVQGSTIVVHGNESERFADLLQTEIRRPMTRGILNPAEPESLSMIRQIVTAMVGPAKRDGQKLCFSVPAAPLGADDNLTYHEATLKQIVNELGYDGRSINEGQAVVYGELEDSNYTGIGISCGGGLCNVCLSYLAVPVMSFAVPKAGDYIDSSAASVTGELANRIRITKEDSFYLNGNFTDMFNQVLGVYYDDMIQSLTTALREAFSSARTLPKMGRPIPLVLSGGSALPKGFRDRFEKLLNDSGFPLPISEIRLAQQPLYSKAKGALVAALSEM